MTKEEHLIHPSIWIRRDAVVNEEVTLIFKTNIQSRMIYGIEYLLSIYDHEKYRHMSSKSDDEVEHVFKDSSNSCKEINIKRESTKKKR